MFLLKNVLYIIGMPIGNIFDLSNRAIFILKNVNIIVAEDSRKAIFLLSFLNINNKIMSLNSYNENYVTSLLLNNIKIGNSLALISDCGTPCISDPGNFLIKFAYDNKISVIPIPGPSVISTVISICSFPINKFIFDGFLPKKRIYKEIIFKNILVEKRSYIFFESGNRLYDTLFLIKNILKYDRIIFLAKDLTKKFEFIFFFNLNDLDDNFFNLNFFLFKGEFVVLISEQKSNFSYLNFNEKKIFKLLNSTFFNLYKDLSINYRSFIS